MFKFNNKDTRTTPTALFTHCTADFNNSKLNELRVNNFLFLLQITISDHCNSNHLAYNKITRMLLLREF